MCICMDGESCVYAFMPCQKWKIYMCVLSLSGQYFVVVEASLKLYYVWHSSCLFLPVELNILIAS